MHIIIHRDTFKPYERSDVAEVECAIAGHCDVEFVGDAEESLFVRTAIYKHAGKVLALAFPFFKADEIESYFEIIEGVPVLKTRPKIVYYPSVEPSDKLRDKIQEVLSEFDFVPDGPSSWAPPDGGNVVALFTGTSTGVGAGVQVSSKSEVDFDEYGPVITVVEPDFTIGELQLYGRDVEPVFGRTCSREDCWGEAQPWVVDGPDWELLLSDVQWQNGERDIRCVGGVDLPVPLRRLTHGLRIGVHTDGPISLMTLRLAYLESERPDWPRIRRTNLEELCAVTGFDVAATLLECGACMIGSREEVVFDVGRQRREFCVSFPSDNSLVPVVAYVLTRVVPILNQE